MVGEASGRQVTASSGKVEIASMGQPVESSFNKVKKKERKKFYLSSSRRNIVIEI